MFIYFRTQFCYYFFVLIITDTNLILYIISFILLFKKKVSTGKLRNKIDENDNDKTKSNDNSSNKYQDDLEIEDNDYLTTRL